MIERLLIFFMKENLIFHFLYRIILHKIFQNPNNINIGIKTSRKITYFYFTSLKNLYNKNVFDWDHNLSLLLLYPDVLKKKQ